MSQRRISRRERERRRKRQVIWGIVAALAVAAVALIGGALNEWVFTPRNVLASVGDVDIRRTDYWKARAAALIEQSNRLRQFAAIAPPEQQQTYQQQAATLMAEVGRVWGSTETDAATLDEMIDDQVYLQRLDSLGLTVADDEVRTTLLNQFTPSGSNLTTPVPTPTFIPARAAMATETAIAADANSAMIATPDRSAADGAVPRPTNATPLPAAQETSPIASPAAAATPELDEIRAIAETRYAEFRAAIFPEAHLDQEDYERLVIRPSVARQEVERALTAEVGQSAEQVRAAHILVETNDLADELESRLTAGEDYDQLAREFSIDEATAGNGGDLGWFAREEMVTPFAEAAFALPPGETSEPIQTEFGWHIIRAAEHDADRALTDAQISAIAAAQVREWLTEQRAALDIDTDVDLAPTPLAGSFEPPVEAPPPPPPTAEAIAPGESTPVASPVAAG